MIGQRINTKDFPLQRRNVYQRSNASYAIVHVPADCTASRLYALAAASFLKAHQEALAVLQKAAEVGLPEEKVRKNTVHTSAGTIASPESDSRCGSI